MKNNLLILLLFTSAYLKAQVTANAGPDLLICIQDTLKVQGTGLNSGDTGSYQWKDLNASIVISNSASFSVKITSLTSRKYELTVTRVSSNVTYSDKDTFILTVSPLPGFKFAGLPPRCYDDGCINLTLNIIASATQGNDTSKKFYDLRYFQKYKKPSWVSGGPVGTTPYKYCPSNFINNSQLPSTGLRDTICYEYKDVNGCYNYECKPLRINPNPVVQVNDGLFCQRIGCIGLDQLAVIPFNKVGGIQSWRCLKVPINSGVDPSKIINVNNSSIPATYCMDPGVPGDNKKTGDYILEYCFKNPSTGCQRCDTSTLTVVRLPEIEFDIIPSQCINSPLVSLDSFVRDSFTGNHLVSGNWQCVAYGGSRDMNNSMVKNAINNSVQSMKYFNPKTGAGQYLLRFTENSSGCAVSDSLQVTVNGLPLVQVFAQDSICSESGKYVLSSNYSFQDTNGKWSGEYVNGNLFNSDMVDMGTSYIKSSWVRYIYKNPLTGCINADSQKTTIIKRPYFKFTQNVKLYSKYLVTFYIIDSNMNLSPFKWDWYYGNGATAKSRNLKEILFLDSGLYDTYLTIDNGICKTSDTISFMLNYRASSIADIYKSIKVYPNPVNAELLINIPFDGAINLSDINGKHLLEDHVHSHETKQINMEKFESGIYLLIIRNDNINYHIKVIKE